MATVIRTGRQTWTPDALGALTPYYETGVVDSPGQLVTIYEDGSNALLGSGNASSTPNASGPYVGWYPYSILISTWSPAAGVLVTGAQATGSTGSVSFSASVPVSGATATGSTGSVLLVEQSDTLNVSGATALGSTGSVSRAGSLPVTGAQADGTTGSVGISASVPVTGAEATGSTGSVTVESGGGAVSVSDDFNRANANPIGGNWTTIPAMNAAKIASNVFTAATNGAGAYWNANVPADAQYAEAKITALETDGSQMAGPAVRISTTQQTGYMVCAYKWSDDNLNYFQLWKWVNGSGTMLGSEAQFNDTVIRLEANGTSIKLRSSSAHGGTFTDRISVTDSAISSGSVGLCASATSATFDDWYGGDL